MDNKKSLLFSIIAVVLMGVIVSGGSFAYFQWSSGVADRSNVDVTIEQSGITMHIETEDKTMGGLRPTRNCNNANAYVDATVTVVNNTGAAAVPSLKIKARVTKELGKAIWQKSYFDHIIVNKKEFDSVSVRELEKQDLSKDFTVLSGNDSLTLPMIAQGARGVISVVANVLPKETSLMVRNALEGNYDEASGIRW